MAKSRAFDVEGVLESSPGGAGGRKSWSLIVHLMPWARIGEPPGADLPLRVEIPVGEKQLQAAMSRLEKGMTVRVRIAKLGRSSDMWHLGHGELPVRKVKGSAALRAATEARAKPVVIKDAELGTLTLDRTYGWFVGKHRIDGQNCELSIEQSSAGGDDRARDLADVAAARKSLAAVARSGDALRRAMVQKLLPLYNKTWRERGGELTADDLLARIKHRSILVSPTRVTLYMSSGRLFGDHGVEVRLSPRGAIREVLIS